MTFARPIATTNAIEAAAFAIVFAREFEESEVEALLSLELSLKDVLPKFDKTSAVTLSVTGDAPAEQTQKLSGVLMQHFQQNGKPDWVLRASENRIVANCLNYDSWGNVWPQARHILLKALQCVDSQTNGVVNTIHQVVDKFIYDEQPTPYSIEDVFNPDSKFLTPHAKESGELWHVFQGWFENVEPLADNDQKILHVLKLSSALGNENIAATIDHTLQSNFSEPLAVKKLIGEQDGNIDEAIINGLFKRMHDKNAELLRSVLSAGQLKAIGLNK